MCLKSAPQKLNFVMATSNSKTIHLIIAANFASSGIVMQEVLKTSQNECTWT